MRRLVLLAAALLTAACTRAPATLPTEEEILAAYPSPGDVRAELSGNVAELTVVQPADQLRRGGELWAKVGPYIYLFTEGTRDLFEAHGGLAGVRVITRAEGGGEVARVLLARDALNDVGWRRAITVAGRARIEGTERVVTIEDLVRFGEENATFEYDPDYVSGR